MNSTRQNTLRLFLAILTCCLGGCSKTPGWFIGKYQFDLETTMKGIKNAESKMTSEKKKDDGLVGAANALALALAPIAFAKVYEDTTITISSSEFIAMKGGSGIPADGTTFSSHSLVSLADGGTAQGTSPFSTCSALVSKMLCHSGATSESQSSCA